MFIYVHLVFHMYTFYQTLVGDCTILFTDDDPGQSQMRGVSDRLRNMRLGRRTTTMAADGHASWTMVVKLRPQFGAFRKFGIIDQAEDS